MLAILTIPGIILLPFILAYFIGFGLKSNTEEERGVFLQDNPSVKVS